jgi:hypothetical protein
MKSTIPFKKLHLKKLHDTYGVDWQQKDLITTYTHTGKFTLKGLAKELNLNPNNLTFIFVEYKPYGSIYYTYTDGIVIEENTFEKYSLIEGDFHSKKNFEEVRKMDNITTYIISVDRKALREPKKHEWSLWNLTGFCETTKRYIYKPSEHKLFDNGYEYRTWNDDKDLKTRLDKSGYSLIAKHRELESKLEVIRRDNLNKVLPTKFNQQNADLFNKLMQEKEELSQELIKACTYNEVEEILDKLDDLSRVIRKYERHIEFLQNVNNPEVSTYHKYTSIREVEKSIAEMESYIEV